MAVANSRPGTYCQLVSEEMDIFSPSEEKQQQQKNSCPIDNQQHWASPWPSPGIINDSEFFTSERHGQEIWQ